MALMYLTVLVKKLLGEVKRSLMCTKGKKHFDGGEGEVVGAVKCFWLEGNDNKICVTRGHMFCTGEDQNTLTRRDDVKEGDVLCNGQKVRKVATSNQRLFSPNVNIDYLGEIVTLHYVEENCRSLLLKIGKFDFAEQVDDIFLDLVDSGIDPEEVRGSRADTDNLCLKIVNECWTVDCVVEHSVESEMFNKLPEDKRKRYQLETLVSTRVTLPS